MIVGFQRPFITALIKPNFDLLKLWSEENQIHWTSPKYMVHNTCLKQRIKEDLDPLNEALPNFQRIRDFSLFDEEWSPESGHLTYTLKLVRHKTLEDFQKVINKLYEV